MKTTHEHVKMEKCTCIHFSPYVKQRVLDTKQRQLTLLARQSLSSNREEGVRNTVC